MSAIAKDVDNAINHRDKNALYRYHMRRQIDDEELCEAIIKIDNSVKRKNFSWRMLIHDILFPSVASGR